MLPSFENILVPVDFTLNTEVAINKTLELVDGEAAVIHLLHVNRPVFPFKRKNPRDPEKKLEQWGEAIRDNYPSVSVQLWIESSVSVQKAIKRKAEEIRAGLIVIGQASTHYLLPILKTVVPMRLAASTQVPVLTVKPGALHNRVKTVVLSITGELSEIKAHMLELLCRRTRLHIHLVTFVDDKNILPEISASTLLKMYQRLKAKLHCPVDYAVLHGTNRAKAILHYAERNNADILLVYPKKETQLGWWDQHIPDILPAHSKVQILAVQPAKGVIEN